MSVAKVIEITSESNNSFDDAVRDGIRKANQTVNGITGAWVKDQQVVVDGGEVTSYRVSLKVTFMLK